MQQWTIDEPEHLTFGDVTSLDVRIVSGRLDVLAGDGPPMLEIAEIDSVSPLLVTYDEDARALTVAYRDLTWDGMLGWLRRDRRRTVLSISVPKTCKVKAGVVSAPALVAGFERMAHVKSVSGDIVLDGVSGDVAANTVSGAVESRAMDGDLSFNSVSGDLTVADGTPHRLRAKTVSGRIVTDLALRPTAHVTFSSVSGDILVRLPENTDADVTARATSGRLISAFDELSNTSSPGARSMSGRLGGGMASLSATTVSGEVTLLKGEKE
ncbi:DUF4097 family beta strand repeat-containing protein [Nonomuraea terrae]|uniref:DUF4097 family beta strand repeat-containing protein n=1 Tax=Nonomuraea terrae TaxID=2530383 RepID=UPI0037A6856F